MDIVEIGWVHPSLRKKPKLLREFFLETLEVHGQGALAADVVHAEVMISLLPPGQTAQEIRRHAAVCPEQVPVVWIPIRIDLHRHLGFSF